MQASIRHNVKEFVNEMLDVKYNGRSKKALIDFYDFFSIAADLRDWGLKSEMALRRPEIKNFIMANYIVNLISGLEVYFKTTIIGFKDKWDEEGVDKLLDVEVKLKDAFILCQRTGIEKVDFISHSNSFQSLERIDEVFSKLVGLKNNKRFIDVLPFSSYEPIKDDHWAKRTDSYKWKDELREAYRLRHKFVHEGFHEEIDKKLFDRLHNTILEIPSNVNKYLENLPTTATTIHPKTPKK